MVLIDKEKKIENDAKKLRELINTLRGWPYLPDTFLGLNQDLISKFNRDKEYFFRKQKILGKVGHDTVYYVKSIFMEAAVDNPEMFDGITHYSNKDGFLNLNVDEHVDDLIRYVTTIDVTEDVHRKRNWNLPHPKWLELRKRIDKSPRNDSGEWELKEVFVEASFQTTLDSTVRGTHYNFSGVRLVNHCSV